MAFFRFDNAAVALRQRLKTGVAETLVKAFAGFAATGNAVDRAAVTEPDRAANQRVHIDQLLLCVVVEGQLVFNRVCQSGVHFLYIAGNFHCGIFVSVICQSWWGSDINCQRRILTQPGCAYMGEVFPQTVPVAEINGVLG